MPALGFRYMYQLARAENSNRLATALPCLKRFVATSLLLEQTI